MFFDSNPNTCTIRIGNAMNRKLTITVSVPQDIEASYLDEASYRDMAADPACEREALEWSEGLIADSSRTEPHASR